MPKRPPRKTTDEARRGILDAAEKRLRDAGPGSIRLQEVAADVGVSHPAILHHFGSREGLVQAVVTRAIERLQADLLSALGEIGNDPNGGAVLFDRVFEVLSARGHGRLVAWLLLSGYDPFGSDAAKLGWAKIAEVTHSFRPKKPKGGAKKASYEDTRFTVVLSALALFGEAVAGDATFRVAGFADPSRTGATYRKWFAGLLRRHLEGDA